MWVDISVGVLGLITLLCVAAAVVWGLTRATDRIQMGTACLFLSTLVYFAIGSRLYGRDGPLGEIGQMLVLYAAALYVVVASLALYFKRWALLAAIGAFVIHLLLGVVVAVSGAASGTVGVGALALWLILGGVGIWACLHPGSRELVG